MRGEILHYDQTTGQGFIAGQDGKRYTFHISHLQQPVLPTVGSSVDFVAAGDSAHEIFIVGGVATPGMVRQTRNFAYDTPPEDLGLWGYYKAALTSNFANFNGRARRKEYWGVVLFNFIIYIGLLVVMFAASPGEWGRSNPQLSPISWLAVAILVLYSLYAILPGIAVTVRRFHDVGQSGWIYLLLLVLGIVPFIGFITSIIMLVITVLDSQPAENKYGISPKGHWVPNR